jgi:DNA primase
VIAVEGYVDVIAMVTAGYAATVAPLGTALTADQLLLLWKMADEPILCFDGDSAGRRAAYRAVDVALPLIKPGKSLKFASLPEGHDPDDLVRAGGRAAVAEVIDAARPLAQVLWMRETEAGAFDTPERRAALEARLGEVTAIIGDDSVRKYYRRDFGDRLRRLLDPGEGRAVRGEPARNPFRPRDARGGQGGWGQGFAQSRHRHDLLFAEAARGGSRRGGRCGLPWRSGSFFGGRRGRVGGRRTGRLLLFQDIFLQDTSAGTSPLDLLRFQSLLRHSASGGGHRAYEMIDPAPLALIPHGAVVRHGRLRMNLSQPVLELLI